VNFQVISFVLANVLCLKFKEPYAFFLPAAWIRFSCLPSVAYPGIFFGGGVQQIQLRTERMEIWRR